MSHASSNGNGVRNGDADQNGDATNRARVESFVLQHRPRPVCARCAATALGLRPSAVQRAATVLEGSASFVRRNATCALCSKNRLVVSARPS